MRRDSLVARGILKRRSGETGGAVGSVLGKLLSVRDAKKIPVED